MLIKENDFFILAGEKHRTWPLRVGGIFFAGLHVVKIFRMCKIAESVQQREVDVTSPWWRFVVRDGPVPLPQTPYVYAVFEMILMVYRHLAFLLPQDRLALTVLSSTGFSTVCEPSLLSPMPYQWSHHSRSSESEIQQK